MKVKIINKKLSSRDADISEIAETDIVEKPLSYYTDRIENTLNRQKGNYLSIQGATITPIPYWCIEFETIEKKFQGDLINQPNKKDGRFIARTAREATGVKGTGQQKEKWRHSIIQGPVSEDSLFSVVSSSWLAPFTITNRYLVFIPAILSSEGKLVLLKDVAREDKMENWINPQTPSHPEIVKWVKEIQQKWYKNKTPKSFKLVTERLNYHHTLVNQKPKSIRLVYTRSRFLKAAVLNPQEKTAFGLPLNKVVLTMRRGIEIIKSLTIPLSGTIVDNMLHYIEVKSVDEAYWLSGLFNSISFQNLVIEESGGKRGPEYVPSIYTIPAKILNRRNLIFDPTDPTHMKISDIAKLLEAEMSIVAKNYLNNEKKIPIDRIDDTIVSPMIPLSHAGVHIDRLKNTRSQDIDKLNNLVKSLLI